MKYVQDICDNVYSLDHVNGFEHEHDEDHNILDLMIVIGNQRFVLISELQLYTAKAESVICLAIELIHDHKDHVMPNKELNSLLKNFTLRFKK